MTVIQPAEDIADLPPNWVKQAQWVCADEGKTTMLGQCLAQCLVPGDTLLLWGDLGSGKTHFARAVIRARLGAAGAAAEIPSPSFTLVQTYEAPEADIWHADLYRLSDPQEVLELGLDDALDTAICLIEWPDRWGEAWPEAAACLAFSTPPERPDTRIVDLMAAPGNALAQRLVGVRLP